MSQFRRWPTERVTRLQELHAAGGRPEDMAPKLGISAAAVRAKAWTLGLKFGRSPNSGFKPQPTVVAPNVLPLVEAALRECPAAAARTFGNRGSQTTCEKSWPLHIAAYVVNAELGFSLVVAGRAIGRDANLAAYAVRRIEDRRDEPAFDAFMERLGDRAREMVA